MRSLAATLLILSISTGALAQSQSTGGPNKKRLKTVLITSSVGYTAGLIGLNQLWYSKFPREGFHFFNDNAEWMQVDKVGHLYSSFHLANSSTHTLLWAGVEEKKAYTWGSIAGAALLIPIEILDGFSSEFGASYGDLIANSAGAALFFGQYKLWQEIRIKPKFSFNRSSLAMQRPDVLGAGIHEEIFKDYNGQTYWLSFDIDKFKRKFPGWLNLAVGYGAFDMLSASRQSNLDNGLRPTRQYYLALDFDLTAIKTKSKVLKTIIFLADIIHLPAPTLEYNSRQNLRGHLLFF